VLCYRDFASWLPPDIEASVVDEISVLGVEDIVQYLTLIGIVGIEDPLRDGVRKAVEDCQKAGVAIQVITC
jgi:Ca2+-transporting ATPase